MTNVRLYGIHDAGGAALLQQGDWIVVSEEIGSGGGNYSQYAERGINVIVRLNHGYGENGTIPEPSGYTKFADDYASFVSHSRGCKHWIVGNEPNHSQERPNGQLIRASDYAACFKIVSNRFYYYFQDYNLLTAAIAPWNVESGDWLAYYQEMLTRLSDVRKSGIALHTYTHGPHPSLITSDARMAAPYEDRRFHFRAYRDFIARTPTSAGHLPYYITETNQGDRPWLNENHGWVQSAYQEIDSWNQNNGPRIVCLCLYRWENYDQWSIRDKGAIHQDLQAAMQSNYTVDVANTRKTFIPIAHGPTTPIPPTSAVEWDERLTLRGASHIPYHSTTNETYYRLTKAHWLDEHESQGKHHIFVELLDEQGNRIQNHGISITWDGGAARIVTNKPISENYAADFGMYAVAPAYAASIEGKSDVVMGMGLGSIEAPDYAIHTSYHLTFQRVVSIPTSAPTPTPVTPTPPTPMPSIDLGDDIEWLIGALSRLTRISVRFLRAVISVESANRPFDFNRRLLIRFENHIFVTRATRDVNHLFIYNKSSPAQSHLVRTSETEGWREVHTGRQDDEYFAFDFARTLDDRSAYLAISMGLGQVMGFNHILLGYPTPQEMYAAFSDGEYGIANQIVGMVTYIVQTPAALKGALNLDWNMFALSYNGSASYALLLKERYDNFG